MIEMYKGMQIIASKSLLGSKTVRMIRVRTHKSKRLDKKFLKKYGMRAIKERGDKTYVMDNKIFVCPVTYKILKQQTEFLNFSAIN